MNKLPRAGLAALAGGALVLGAVAPPASAEPAGKYDYYCTGVDGVQRSWNTSPLASCNGWMDVYISGKRINHVNYANAYIRYQLSRPTHVISLSCVVSGAGFLLSVPGSTTGVGVAATVASLASLGMSCG